ncbi:MAG: MmcQ/YjbR family DNA-binding protein [Akkermansiaceae bacterium]
MPKSNDPTEAIRNYATSFPEVEEGMSCNQTSFKVGKGSFLFIGPGPKGVGFKAMFKLKDSMPEAQKLAEENPDQFQAGSTGWVTARFSVENPLPKRIWGKWVKESYAVTKG